MNLVLLCATRRGYLFLRKITELLPNANLFVFSFREEPWEPPFLHDIRDLTLSGGGRFLEAGGIGSEKWSQFWESTSIDLMFVVSWRYLIPTRVYNKSRLGTFVFHDSLLPKYRGFSPTVWSIINGEDHTGVTLFEIAADVDAGDIVDQEPISIGSTETISEIMERVTKTYLKLLERNIDGLMNGTHPRRPQDHAQATYTCKWIPDDNKIDWAASSETIFNLIRAVSHPYPGAYTKFLGEKMRIWSAKRLPDFPHYVGRVTGRVVDVRAGEGAVVLTGDGAILVEQVQTESGPIRCAADVLNSYRHSLG